MTFEKKIGRLTVYYNSQYGSNACVEVRCVDGWNDSCPELCNRLSIEEVHDLMFVLSRLLYVTDNV